MIEILILCAAVIFYLFLTAMAFACIDLYHEVRRRK